MLKGLLKRDKPSRQNYSYRFIVGRLDSQSKLETFSESASMTTESGQVLLFVNQDELNAFKIRKQVNDEHMERERSKGLDDFSALAGIPYPHLGSRIYATVDWTPEQIAHRIENTRAEILDNMGILPVKPVHIPCENRLHDFIACLEVTFND